MKKLMAMVLSASMILGIASMASAEENGDVQKALELIEKTNREIDEKIVKGVEKADELQRDYVRDIREIEEGKEIRKIKEEKETTLSELAKVGQDERKQKKLNERLAKLKNKLEDENNKLDEKISGISQELDELSVFLLTTEGKDKEKIEKKISKLKEKMDRSEEHQARTEKYLEELGSVIDKVYDETFEMSKETIEKVANYGIKAECSWTLVRFADKWVWIDPVRVVGL